MHRSVVPIKYIIKKLSAKVVFWATNQGKKEVKIYGWNEKGKNHVWYNYNNTLPLKNQQGMFAEPHVLKYSQKEYTLRDVQDPMI